MPLPARIPDKTLNAEIERLLYQSKVVREEAEGLVWGLSDDQFNWSPGPGQWSLGQCIDHLNVAGRQMLEKMEVAIREARAAGILGEGPYAYGFFSRWFLRLMQPPVKRRFKAPPKFQPSPRLKMTDVLAEWGRIHTRLEDLLHDASGLDLARIKITSPVNSLIRYPLGVAFWIQLAHDRRHLWQGRNVRNLPVFPQ